MVRCNNKAQYHHVHNKATAEKKKAAACCTEIISKNWKSQRKEFPVRPTLLSVVNDDDASPFETVFELTKDD